MSQYTVVNKMGERSLTSVLNMADWFFPVRLNETIRMARACSNNRINQKTTKANE